MKKLFYIPQAESPVDIALLILRLTAGIFMLHHGYSKMENFTEMQYKFISFLGLGGSISLCLTIFAEFFCSIALIFGMFSRLVLIPLLINIFVAIIVGHQGDIFGKGEPAALYFMMYLVLIISGPGKYSVDAILAKKIR